MAIKHLLVNILTRKSKHVRQMTARPDSAILFTQTHFYWPYQFHGDTKLNENAVKDLTPN
jgi:hypothetical protein